MLMPPGLNGLQTYKQILAIHPGQKAVIASGFSENKDVRETLQLGAASFIKKPYVMEQLSQVMYNALH
jgi:DNA-binding NarL/FixJ family response regulator